MNIVTIIPKDEEEVRKLLDKFLVDEKPNSLEYLMHAYGMSEMKAKDVYQDSSIALFVNIHEGKLVTLTKSLNGYFRQVCKFQALKALGKIKYDVSLDDIPETRSENPYDNNKIEELLGMTSGYSTRIKEALFELVDHMPEPCRTILMAFHYDQKKYEDIVKMVPGLTNANSAKVRRSQCQSKLKNKFESKIKEIKYGEED